MNQHGDVKKWVEKVINSCVTWEQTIPCFGLIRNFEKQLVAEDKSKYRLELMHGIILPLQKKLLDKRDNILMKK